jgi:CheY-like chemotaxis protein
MEFNRSELPLLVVEDDDDFRKSLVETLQQEGYRVAEVSNGRQALEWLRQGERPRLVLLDLWMPTMDGWQLRQALQRPPFDDLPIVVMSAARAQGARILGVADVLEKPFSVDRLLAVLALHA